MFWTIYAKRESGLGICGKRRCWEEEYTKIWAKEQMKKKYTWPKEQNSSERLCSLGVGVLLEQVQQLKGGPCPFSFEACALASAFGSSRPGVFNRQKEEKSEVLEGRKGRKEVGQTRTQKKQGSESDKEQDTCPCVLLQSVSCLHKASFLAISNTVCAGRQKETKY